MDKLKLPSWPILSDDDVRAVVAVLRSDGFSTSSNVIESLEHALAEYHAVEECIAVSSGTAAVHLALIAAGVKSGDEVVVPTHTFVGSAAPIAHIGATPVFADVDPVTFCITQESFSRATSSRTRAVIVVHLNGNAADVVGIKAMADRLGIRVIEDCAQALGTEIDGRPVGTFGDFSCFSLWKEKIITASEGGFILTDSSSEAEVLRRLRNHGERISPQDERFYWSHELGFNYRMTSMGAALAHSQFNRLAEFIQSRRSNAFRYTELLRECASLVTPVEKPGTRHTFWKYVLRSPTETGIDVGSLVFRLRASGVPAMLRYPYPLHLQPPFVHDPAPQLPVAERLSRELFTLPSHPALTPSDVDHVADRLLSLLTDHA
jgi:perosamine synthetase